MTSRRAIHDGNSPRSAGFLCLALIVTVFSVLPCVSANSKPVVREEGVIYLSDLEMPPLRLKLKKPAPAFFGKNLEQFAGHLRFPQQVEVQAITPGAFRVRGNARQGQVLAWTAPEFLEIPDGLVEKIEEAAERQRIVNDLIAANEVAIGMTLAEVKKSVGRPQKTTKRATEEGTEEVWEYIRYKNVPQQTIVNTPTGPAQSIIYVRVPVGTLQVFCREGVVTALEQTEGTLVGARSSIVVPPVVVPW